MKVTLLDHTGAGFDDPWHAAHLLIFTKNTRVKMAPDGLKEITSWPEEKKIAELDYMANTIRSSWEFVDYVFMLEDVTRAFTHQLVRTRHASYAQQTQQILEIDASAVEPPRGDWYLQFHQRSVGNSDVDPDGVRREASRMWDHTVGVIANAYRSLIARGVPVEDARGLLPTNIKTNIVVKLNLRTLVEVIHSRISPRNLGEYRDVAVRLRDEVLLVHPWASVFVDSTRDRVLADMDKEVADLGGERKNRMLKLVDQLRRG